MTPRFLREESARFRDMAESSNCESSKQRLLTMAADFEARASAGEQVVEPASEEAASPVEVLLKPRTARRLGKESTEAV